MKKFFPIAFLFLFLLMCGSANAQKQSHLTLNLKPGGASVLTRSHEKTKDFIVAFVADSPVEVYVLDINNLVLFNGDKSFTSYFSSGRVSSGAFSLRLPKGYYYLVVSNKFSYITSKTVRLTFYD